MSSLAASGCRSKKEIESCHAEMEQVLQEWAP